jgi:hypothetical protein
MRNSLPLTLDFPSDCPPELRPYIPNVSFLPPALLRAQRAEWRDIAMKSLVVIATRDIYDEELFMDYRFNKEGHNLPEWYKNSITS